MYKRIAVALDGSALAEIAIPYAQELALRFGSELDIITVCEPPNETESMRRAYIEKISAELGRSGLRLHSIVLYGKPADAILDYAELNKINLIAMSTHGRSGIGRWVLGSVADKILLSASCPILLISANKNNEPKLESAVLKRILLPLDGSPLAECALPHVEELASKTHAEVLLLQIIKPLDRAVPIEGYAINLAGIYGDVLTQAKSYLSKVEQHLKQKGITVHSEVISGLPATSIVDYAHDKGVDLIAMSTHGRGGLSRLVLGSVANKVLRGSDTPVLLVKASQITEHKV